MNKKVYIGVGANINPEENIKKAFRMLGERVRVTGCSTFYTTPALGTPGPDFINGVWEILTEIPPDKLKGDLLRPLEEALGRVRSEDKYAPRPLDLDILLYGDLVDEKIPDPDIYTRPFIGIPLRELAPELKLPDKNIYLKSIDYLDGDMVPDKELTRFLKGLLNSFEEKRINNER